MGISVRGVTYNMWMGDLWTTRHKDDSLCVTFLNHLNLETLVTEIIPLITRTHTISRDVVPRTILSSTRHTTLSLNSDAMGDSFRRTLFCRAS